ncbi:FxsA family protein [Sphaerisporangium sp. TRM90804]|uniref:FxsA family protein n=1 Tax=Sphaerisporangium sp. TRM90804 TaxID=3031113 RepID=UPI002447C13B|nr:FxsA family protein [Sphaerisporangium sp. TRM90804]MDH2430536.1 FxsA family protein [Sphaerisporangium sp. TRM90804]
MLRVLLFLAFLVVPVLEIWLLIQIGQVIGGWQTVGLLILDSLLGAWLVRAEGRRAWRALREALQSGRMPERELADAAMIVAGGTLLLTPGFLTDVLGFFLILPFTRPLARRALGWFLGRRVRVLAGGTPFGVMFPPGQGGPGSPTARSPFVPGQVIHDDGPAARRPRNDDPAAPPPIRPPGDA